MLVAYFISYGQPITKARAYIKTDLDLDSITDDELIELVKKEIPKQ
ncbi:hypothetical protein JIY74_27560 [Vibrio harveyi]|nr:hypothetical protein [Vibrio harveyi]